MLFYTGLPPPRSFRYTLQNFDASFFWEDPILPGNIQLTNYIIAYNVTDAFNQDFSDSILIPGEDNNYVLNTACSYEAGVALCPSSHYCFTLRGVYYKNSTAIETVPTNKICFNTSVYRKLFLVNFHHRIYLTFCI